MRPGAVGLC